MLRRGTWAVLPALLVLAGCAPIESEVESVSPAPGAVTATATFDITVDFDHAMNPDTITDSTFVVSGSQSGTHTGVFTYFADDTRVVFTSSVLFIEGETITVRLTDAISSRSDKDLESYTWSFDVAPATPVEPSPLFVQSMTPAVESTAGILTGNFAVTFNSAVDPASIDDGVITIEGERSGQRVLTFDPIITSLPVPTLPFTIDRPFLVGERVTLSVSSDLLGFTGEIALPSVVQFTTRQLGTNLGTFDHATGSGLVG